MAHKIIQWNCRGLRSHYNDLAILLQEHSPTAVCLQETNLKPNTNISFKNYSIKNCFGPANNERACWGGFHPCKGLNTTSTDYVEYKITGCGG